MRAFFVTSRTPSRRWSEAAAPSPSVATKPLVIGRSPVTRPPQWRTCVLTAAGEAPASSWTMTWLFAAAAPAVAGSAANAVTASAAIPQRMRPRGAFIGRRPPCREYVMACLSGEFWSVLRRVGPMTYLSQLVDQLDRLQLERATSTPSLEVELQLDRLQLERAKSAVRPSLALLHEERLQD